MSNWSEIKFIVTFRDLVLCVSGEDRSLLADFSGSGSKPKTLSWDMALLPMLLLGLHGRVKSFKSNSRDSNSKNKVFS